MGQLAGCAQFGRYLALLLVGGLAIGYAVLSSGGQGLTAPGNSSGGVLRSTPNGIPPISDRYFGSGSATAVVSGDLTMNLTLPIDVDQAYAKSGLGWLAFGVPGEPQAILVTLDEPENSVAVSNGAETALGVGGQCEFTLTIVTARKIEGSVECTEADALRGGQVVGQVTITVDFEANS